MNKKIKMILLVLLAVVLVAEIGFLAAAAAAKAVAARLDATEPSTATEVTDGTEATEATAGETGEPTEEETLAVEETIAKAEVVVTKPQEDDNRFVLTFTGDCTFGTTNANRNSASHFIKTIGTDYDYPFANVVDYFEADDFTMINLEGVLAESGSAANKLFTFRGPTTYTQIMTGSSVEAVTLANNHTEDFGKAGYKSTVEALEKADIAYVEKNASTLYTTESGLKIGLYAAAFNFSGSDIKSEIAALRKAGAEVVICAFHWGVEGAYRPNGSQQSVAHQAIDAGADIVYGHHPHVLQKIEEYNDGIIYYSLGNFCFGGSVYPQDYDSAILQQEIIREDDGSISLGKLTIIPVSISSITSRNNFQPTPLPSTNKAYDRILSKLDGSFTGPNLVVDYGDDEDEETKPAATEPPKTNTPATEPEKETQAPTTGETQAPSGGNSGGATEAPSGGSTEAPSGGSTEAPSGGSTGAPSGGSTEAPSGGSSSGNESGGGSSSGGESGGESGGGSSGGESGSGSSSGGESGGSSSGDSGSGVSDEGTGEA